MADVIDDDKIYFSITDMSSGQYSSPHPTDKILMPVNSGAEMLNIDIDEMGKRRKRKGYTIVGDDSGSVAIAGKVGYSPVSKSKTLLREVDGVVESWDGTSGTWDDSKTGLTAATYTELVVAKGLVFRLGQTDNIWSFDGTDWTDEGDTSADPPKGKLGIWTSNQRFLVFNTAANPNFGYMSDAGDPQTFGDAPFAFGDGEDSGVTGAVEFTDGEVAVLTDKSLYTWNISNTTSANWTVKKVADVGCVAQRTVKQIGTDVLFLSSDGVRSIFQSAQDKKRGDSLPLTFPIKDWVARINWAFADKAIAWVWNDLYHLAVPIDNSEFNNYTFVFSRRAFEVNGGKGGWTIYEGVNINAFATQSFGGTRRLYIGEASADSKSYFFRSDDVSSEPTSDNGVAITFSEEGKRIEFESPSLNKLFNKAEFQLEVQAAGTINVEAQVDGEGYTTIGTIDQTVGVPTLEIDLPFNLVGTKKVKKTFFLEKLGRGRNIQFRLTESTIDADVTILNYSISAYVDAVEFE